MRRERIGMLRNIDLYENYALHCTKNGRRIAPPKA